MLKNLIRPGSRRIGLIRAKMFSTELKPAVNNKLEEPTDIHATVRSMVPSDFDKKLLVYFKRYNSIEEIPNRVSLDTLGKVRSQMRIRLCNVLMVSILMGCFGVSWWGKKRAQRGESLTQILLDKDQKILDEYKKQQLLAKQEK